MITGDSLAKIFADYHYAVRARYNEQLGLVSDAINGWIDGVLREPLPDDWREQFGAVLDKQAAQGRQVIPESVRELEEWIEGWATEYGMLPTDPPREHAARWWRRAEPSRYVQTTAAGTQTVSYSEDGSFVIQVTPNVSGPPEPMEEAEAVEQEEEPLEVAGPGPNVSESFQEHVRLIVDILDPEIGEWWAGSGVLRSRDATSWWKALLSNHYSEQVGDVAIIWVDENYTTADAAEAVIAEASDESTTAGQMFREWRAGRYDAVEEFVAWQSDALKMGAQQAAAFARMYYESVGSLAPGGDLLLTVNDVGEEGLQWRQALDVLPGVTSSQTKKAGALAFIVLEGKHVRKVLELSQKLIDKLAKLKKLNPKAYKALLAKAKKAKNKEEALEILERGVVAGASKSQVPAKRGAVGTARAAVRAKPPFPPPVAEARVTNMKGRNYPHPNHVKAAQSEERLARDVHAQPDEVVLQWGKPIGTHGADIISYNYKTGKITLWDDKYRSQLRMITASKTFTDESRALSEAIEEAQRVINASNLSKKDKLAALSSLDTTSYNPITHGSGNAKNSTIGLRK